MIFPPKDWYEASFDDINSLTSLMEVCGVHDRIVIWKLFVL